MQSITSAIRFISHLNNASTHMEGGNIGMMVGETEDRSSVSPNFFFGVSPLGSVEPVLFCRGGAHGVD